MIKWTRKTSEFQYAPYISEDGKYRVQDIDSQPIIDEYNYLKNHNWDSKESHETFLRYCKEHRISLNGANWAVVDNKTNEVIKFPFKSAKSAKEFAERL